MKTTIFLTTNSDVDLIMNKSAILTRRCGGGAASVTAKIEHTKYTNAPRCRGMPRFVEWYPMSAFCGVVSNVRVLWSGIQCPRRRERNHAFVFSSFFFFFFLDSYCRCAVPPVWNRSFQIK